MKRRYSVFFGNVGSCSDRYCPSYAPEFKAAWLNWLESLLDRADLSEIDGVVAQGDGVASSRLMRRLLQGGAAS